MEIEKSKRIYCAISSIFGTYWALIAWALPTIGIIAVVENFPTGILHSLAVIAMIVLVGSGYIVWFGWIMRGYFGKPFLSERRFFGLSLIVHLAWLGLFFGSVPYAGYFLVHIGYSLFFLWKGSGNRVEGRIELPAPTPRLG